MGKGKKLIITDDKEKFTRSSCDCNFCKETHDIVDRQWGAWTNNENNQNNLTRTQKAMKKVVDNIEKKYKNTKNK